jgi:hypothetical protein
LVAALFLLAISGAQVQPAAPMTPASTNIWTTQQDHRNMMQQLGIRRLRPGPSSRGDATNAANYDPAKANPFPDLPEALTLTNGH